MNRGNSEQIEFWNGEAGQRWAAQDAYLQELLEPICTLLLDAAEPVPDERAVDIGCGCGSQTVALARRLGSKGAVLGVDISAPMLAVARQRPDIAQQDVAPIEFLQADAAKWVFPPAAYDLLFSRFGVMFFGDPPGAFANLRRALLPGGRLAFSCWQEMKRSDFMLVPLLAALQHLPAPEPPPPHAPGPFAFADRSRVQAILEESGFVDVRVEAFEQMLGFSARLSIEEAAGRMLDLGPVSRVLEEADADAAMRQRVLASLLEALEPHVGADGLRLKGRGWLVTATNPA